MRKRNKLIFYIDPQSMINLAKYDYLLLENIHLPIMYFCSKYYDYKENKSICYKKLFKYNKKRSNLSKAISYIISYLHVFIYIAKYHPHIIHLQWLRIPTFDYYFYKTIKTFFCPKLIYTAHNLLPHDDMNNRKGYYRFYHLADQVIVHTQDTKNELIRQFDVPSESINVIRHGIIKIEASSDLRKRTEKVLNKKYDLKNKIVFSSLGYQSLYKGIDLICDIWANTQELRNNPKCCLLVVGKSRVDLSAISHIDNVIIIDKIVSDDEFLYYLSHTDVCLLPYRNISQSGLLLTAIAEHVPVLISNIGGLAEVLSIAPIGWTITNGDINELRETMLHLIHNPSEIEKVKNDGHSWSVINENYNWKNISTQTQQLYESLL